MASSGGVGFITEPPSPPPFSSSQEVFQWLKNLPLAPEYHPTLSEFQDPISYIFKIEKEASKYGICKIVPPLLPSSKKATISNLNRSLASRSPSTSPTFTTRQQQIGFCPRKARPVQKPVWQSGEYYTFPEFEAKAKSFEKNYLKKCYKKGQGGLSPLEIETLYWKATVDKPFSVEYANDMPGSAFSARKSGGNGESVCVGETEWNMRGVSRAKGSLLRFMKEEIPGVTSPMVYIAMLFSWFAWHVEDHDLHSLNYLHMGAGKTWYGVPREAAVAFEEVVRVHGYGGEFNPLVTFAVLGEKTTVISPEVFISAGVPCCRLVQNAGEFVVTFPRAYHSGFSHGFNCGEASNIATPEWLRVAKDAAIRRASINYPPMVSHFQLLYDLALELCTRIPKSISSKPRSSRLKDKQKVEDETLVKDTFVKSVAHNSGLLYSLGNGSSVVILPDFSSISLSSNFRSGSQLNVNSGFGLSNHNGFMKSLKGPVPYNIMSDNNSEVNQNQGLISVKGKVDFLYEHETQTETVGSHCGSDICNDKLLDQRLFSCVTCGVLSFDCVAIIQPSEGAARYLMSADRSFFNDRIVSSGVTSYKTVVGSSRDMLQTFSTRLVGMNGNVGPYDASVQSSNHRMRTVDQSVEAASNNKPRSEGSALGLLAVNYGDSSSDEEEHSDSDISHDIDETKMGNTLQNGNHLEDSSLPSFKQECNDVVNSTTPSIPGVGFKNEIALQNIGFHANDGRRVANLRDINNQSPDQHVEFETDHVTFRSSMPSLHLTSAASVAPTSDEDSCCMHVFCLEHAIEVEQQLRSIGGAQILLLCHPEYRRIEDEAKSLSEELGIDYIWNEITYREATKEDEERIKSALDSVEAIPGNGDWAVKLGINLFYSANLSQSSLYIKQMPYNSVIYNAFGRNSSDTFPTKLHVYTRRPARQRKVVAGRWCGKVWMSNQVHPLLVKQDSDDQEQERSCIDSAMADENMEKRSQSDHKSRNTSVSSKYGRKRKVASRGVSAKKFKCFEREDALSDHSAGSDFCKQSVKTCGRRKTKFIKNEVSYGSEDSSHQKHGRIHRSKLVKSVERDDAVSDNSLEDDSTRPCRRIVNRRKSQSNNRDNVIPNNLSKSSSHRQHRTIPKSKQAKLVVKESAASDDSFEDDGHGWQGRVSGNRQDKFVDREDALSDDLPEGNSHWLQSRSKQAFYSEKEVSASGSDDLPDDSLLHQLRRVPRGNSFKLIESENAVSDDSMEEDTYQQQVRSHRSKLGKCIKRGDGVSDDNSDQQPKIRGSKKCKVVEWRAGSRDNDINQNHRRIPKNKKANFSESEDAVSDDSVGDITQKERARVSKGKRARYADGEDLASDDLEQNNFYQRSREVPRGKKQVKYFKREEVLYDLAEESNQQKSRVLKTRQKKLITLGLTRRNNSQFVKGTQRSMKKAPSRSIKLEIQLKHETPQLQKNKHEQNARDCDSQVEWEQERGPNMRLRKRPPKPSKKSEMKMKEKLQSSRKTTRNASTGKPVSGRSTLKVKDEEAEYQCDIEGCTMGFDSKQDLALHKKNICPVKGCGKKFFSHKYLVQHRRVHLDDRPLKCPWKGCKMTFKWAWARTEHIRVHTGARPYICSEEGCGQTFRFVSDFSRHKRKTGHSAKKIRG